ncbi:MAG: hypothetical protein ACSW8C_02595 [bacterium]
MEKILKLRNLLVFCSCCTFAFSDMLEDRFELRIRSREALNRALPSVPFVEAPHREAPFPIPSFLLLSPLENPHKKIPENLTPGLDLYGGGLPSLSNFDTHFMRTPHKKLPVILPPILSLFGEKLFPCLNLGLPIALPFIPYDRESSSVLPVLHDTVNFGENPVVRESDPTEQPASKRMRGSELNKDAFISTPPPCVLASSVAPKYKRSPSTDSIEVRLKMMQDSKSNTLNMTNIDLGNSETFKEFIDVVLHNPSINGLILHDCNIDSHIIRSFATEGILGRLNKLYLNNNSKIGDNGVKFLANALKGNTSLRYLRLTNCNVTDIGLWDLLWALEGNTSLQELGLRENMSITDISVASFLNVLPSTKIDSVGMGKCRVSGPFVRRIHKMIKSREGQNLCTRESSEELKEKPHLKDSCVLNLKSVSLKESANIEEVVSVLNTFPTIENLCLQKCNIGDASASLLAEVLKSNTSLKMVNLDSNNISNEGAWAIAEALKINKNLKTLSLFCNNIGDEGALAFVEALKINTTLKRLNLCCNNISDVGIKILTEALPFMHLEVFYYSIQK